VSVSKSIFVVEVVLTEGGSPDQLTTKGFCGAVAV